MRAITPEIEAMAGDAGSELSKGGMKTKVEAGKIALGSGANMVIASGKRLHPLRRSSKARRDMVRCASDAVTARKRWIAGQLEPAGAVHARCGR